MKITAEVKVGTSASSAVATGGLLTVTGASFRCRCALRAAFSSFSAMLATVVEDDTGPMTYTYVSANEVDIRQLISNGKSKTKVPTIKYP